jgi:predicted RNA-binding protein
VSSPVTGVQPYRVDVELSSCKEAPIKPLIERLSFIRSKMHWGGAFRFGYVKVPEADFALVADAMKPTSSSQNGA